MVDQILVPNLNVEWDHESEWRSWEVPNVMVKGLGGKDYLANVLAIVGEVPPPGVLMPLTVELVRASRGKAVLARVNGLFVGKVACERPLEPYDALAACEGGCASIAGLLRYVHEPHRKTPEITLYTWPTRRLTPMPEIFLELGEAATGWPLESVQQLPDGRYSAGARRYEGNVEPNWTDQDVWGGWSRPLKIVRGTDLRDEVFLRLIGPRRPGGYRTPRRITLRRDPTNMHDRNAVQVLLHGSHIGFIAREIARSLSPGMASIGIDEYDVPGIVVGGSTADAHNFGCWIWWWKAWGQYPNIAIDREEFQVWSSTWRWYLSWRDDDSPAPRDSDNEAAYKVGANGSLLNAKELTAEQIADFYRKQDQDRAAAYEVARLKERDARAASPMPAIVAAPPTNTLPSVPDHGDAFRVDLTPSNASSQALTGILVVLAVIVWLVWRLM